MRETVSLIAVLISIFGCSLGVFAWTSAQIESLRNEIRENRVIAFDSVKRQGDLAASIALMAARVETLEGKPRKTVVVRDSEGNIITETIDYVAETPKRIGKRSGKNSQEAEPVRLSE